MKNWDDFFSKKVEENDNKINEEFNRIKDGNVKSISVKNLEVVKTEADEDYGLFLKITELEGNQYVMDIRPLSSENIIDDE